MTADQGIKPIPDEIPEDEAQEDRELIAEILDHLQRWTDASRQYSSSRFNQPDNELIFVSIVDDGNEIRMMDRTKEHVNGYSVDIALTMQSRGISIHQLDLKKVGNPTFLVDPTTNITIDNFTTEIMSYKSPFARDHDNQRIVVTLNETKGVQYTLDEDGLKRIPRSDLFGEVFEPLSDDNVLGLFREIDTIMPQPQTGQTAESLSLPESL